MGEQNLPTGTTHRERAIVQAYRDRVLVLEMELAEQETKLTGDAEQLQAHVDRLVAAGDEMANAVDGIRHYTTHDCVWRHLLAKVASWRSARSQGDGEETNG
jgi:hypothetical protein